MSGLICSIYAVLYCFDTDDTEADRLSIFLNSLQNYKTQKKKKNPEKTKKGSQFYVSTVADLGRPTFKRASSLFRL